MTPSPRPAPGFATTRWSLVAAAQHRADEALADLCRLYWYPLYAYVRRRGHDAAEAEDLTQAFFARLLEKNGLATVTPTRGRFRSFLLTACRNFLSNERERENAAKRGGGKVVSFDQADERYRREPNHEETAERLFERRWALELLDVSLRRLREECDPERFEALKGVLTGDAVPYSEVASRLGISEGAVKTAVHRLRARYAELLREEIAETVETPAEIDDEVRNLFRALGG